MGPINGMLVLSEQLMIEKQMRLLSSLASCIP
jgi:hypothetical protein